MDRARVSAIVPTMNRKDDLLEFAATLVKQTHRPDLLVVVDAGSVPDIDVHLRDALAGSGIRLIHARSTPGTSLQRNVALDLLANEPEAAAPEHFVFLFDDDVLLEPDYVERTLACFDLPTDPPVGCVLGTFTSPSRPRGWQQTWFRTFGMTRSVEGDEAALGAAGGVRWLIEPSHPVEVPVASGGRTAYRYACFLTERFDEFLPGYTMNEDVELSFRVARNWTIVHTPDAKLFHKRSPGARVDYGDRVSRLIYSSFYFFRKHRPKDARHLAAFAWTNLGIAAFYTGVGALRSEPGHRRDVVRGIADGYARCLGDLKGPR